MEGNLYTVCTKERFDLIEENNGFLMKLLSLSTAKKGMLHSYWKGRNRSISFWVVGFGLVLFLLVNFEIKTTVNTEIVENGLIINILYIYIQGRIYTQALV